MKYDITPTPSGFTYWHRGMFDALAYLMRKDRKPMPTITIGQYRMNKCDWELHGAELLKKIQREVK